MSSRYFFYEATNLGWYLLPEERRQEWLDLMIRWNRLHGEQRETVLQDIETCFGFCRLDGELSDWCFTQPTRVVLEKPIELKKERIRLRSWRKPIRR